MLECCLAQCWNVGCSEVGLEVPDRVPLQTSLDQWHQLARVPGYGKGPVEGINTVIKVLSVYLYFSYAGVMPPTPQNPAR